MSRTRYGVRYWLDRTSPARLPAFPVQRGPISTDVAIVGGGAAGCAIAYVFAAAGIRTTLFESGRIAQHETAGSSGIVLHELEPDLQKLIGQHGLRAARHLYQSARRGSLEYLAALKRLRIECGLRMVDCVHVGLDADGVDRLRREYTARRAAGIEAASMSAAALSQSIGFGAFAVRTRGHAVLDPYRATVGFAKAAAARGAQIFEKSPVSRIRSLRRGVEMRTPHGLVAASSVVVATGFPTDDFKPLHRRFARCHSYLVLTPELPVRLRRQMTPEGFVVRDTAAPDHWLRWVGGRLLFAGGDQRRLPERLHERSLVQRTGQLMYELSVMKPAISGYRARVLLERRVLEDGRRSALLRPPSQLPVPPLCPRRRACRPGPDLHRRAHSAPQLLRPGGQGR